MTSTDGPTDLRECENLVWCEECGNPCTMLPNHLRQKHGLTVEEYRARYGRDVRVVAENTGKDYRHRATE